MFVYEVETSVTGDVVQVSSLKEAMDWHRACPNTTLVYRYDRNMGTRSQIAPCGDTDDGGVF